MTERIPRWLSKCISRIRGRFESNGSGTRSQGRQGDERSTLWRDIEAQDRIAMLRKIREKYRRV